MKKLLLLLLFAFASQTHAQNDDDPTSSTGSCWKQLDAGANTVIGIKEDGTLWGWGNNILGVLGNASETVSLPIQIGTDNDWNVVSAGNGHVMALKNNGSLWTWGSNQSGALGNGTVTFGPNPIPAQVGTAQDWASISAGGMHCAAIKTDGTLWTWGYNGSGELGNGLVDTGIAQTTIPTQVGSNTDWKTVCSSADNTVALKTNGTLWVTGEGNHGEIGNGAFNDVAVFTQVGSDTDWDVISFEGSVASVIKTDGTLWGWGSNFSGGVGNGTNTNVASPVQIGTDNTWKSVGRTYNYSAGAIKQDGSLWTWGYNYNGALGDGTTEDKNVPVQIASDVAWKSYHGAGNYSVALKEDGSLYVWGDNWYGELGFNLEDNTVLSPVKVEENCEVIETPTTPDDEACWDKIACGYLSSVAIKTNGTLWAWGSKIEENDIIHITSPEQIGTDADWVEVIGTQETFFAIKSNGTLWGWGLNTDGQIGDGTIVNKQDPVQIGTDTDWKTVSPGAFHTLALKTNGTIWGWGKNTDNQLPGISEESNPVPVQIGLDTDWQTVSAGFSNGLGIKTNGTLWTWGNHAGTTDTSYHQVGSGSDWKTVTGGYWYTAALKTDGTLWTWGINHEGELGLGYSSSFVLEPTKVNNDMWLDVKSDWHSTSALKTDGTWWGWGQQVEPNDETSYNIVNVLSPTLMNEDNDWATISMGQFFMMGIKSDGALWGLGLNDFDQLKGSLPWNTYMSAPLQLWACSEETAGLNDNTLTSVTLYPNPTASALTLANAENLTIESLTVTDMTGKLVLSQKGNNAQIDVEKLPAGIYFLKVSAKEGSQHLKFIKE